MADDYVGLKSRGSAMRLPVTPQITGRTPRNVMAANTRRRQIGGISTAARVVLGLAFLLLDCRRKGDDRGRRSYFRCRGSVGLSADRSESPLDGRPLSGQSISWSTIATSVRW